MEGYLGTVMAWAPNFAPRNWAFCQGQLLQISQNAALYSLLGTTYGGNGTTTFGLPNLMGRVVVGNGNGAGLQPYTLGQLGGHDLYSLTQAQLPAHAHANTVAGQASAVTSSIAIPSVSNSDANALKPGSAAVPGKMPSADIYSTNAPDGTLKPFNATGTVTPVVSINNALAGSGAQIDNRQPFQALNFIICLYGIFPARN